MPHILFIKPYQKGFHIFSLVYSHSIISSFNFNVLESIYIYYFLNRKGFYCLLHNAQYSAFNKAQNSQTIYISQYYDFNCFIYKTSIIIKVFRTPLDFECPIQVFILQYRRLFQGIQNLIKFQELVIIVHIRVYIITTGI